MTEYCSVAFHSSLTLELSNKLERIQKTCVKIILWDMYMDIDSALEMCGLDTLLDRRIRRCLDFAKKSTKHTRNRRLFPLNKNLAVARTSAKYQVNFARTNTYRDSTIPYCQRLLNSDYQAKKQ